MSSNSKQVKDSSRDIRTNSVGRRYVDFADVIKSEVARIEGRRDTANSNSKPDRGQNGNGVSGSSGDRR